MCCMNFVVYLLFLLLWKGLCDVVTCHSCPWRITNYNIILLKISALFVHESIDMMSCHEMVSISAYQYHYPAL